MILITGNLNKKKLSLLFLVLVVFSCKSKKTDSANAKPAQQPVGVDIVIAGQQRVTNTVELTGSVLPYEMVEIKPEISGRLTYLNVADGMQVAAGTVLGKINDAELQAQVAKSRSQLSMALKTEERLRKLLAIEGVNKADYDLAQNTVNNIKADLQLLKAQIDKTIIRAPFGGVLGLRMVSPGAYITPQNSIATLQQNSKVKIDFSVPDIYAHLIKKGTAVSIQSNVDDYRRTAIVIATESTINTSTRNLKVRAVIDGEPISPGSFVKVFLDANAGADKIVIPTNAIIPDATSKKLVVVKNGKANFVNVETGLRTANGVEITSGINIGDSVVVTGVLFAKPNAPLKVKSVKNLADLTGTQN